MVQPGCNVDKGDVIASLLHPSQQRPAYIRCTRSGIARVLWPDMFGHIVIVTQPCAHEVQECVRVIRKTDLKVRIAV